MKYGSFLLIVFFLSGCAGTDKAAAPVPSGHVEDVSPKNKEAAASTAPAAEKQAGMTAGAYLGRGIMYASRGEYEKAVADFSMAIRLEPGRGEAYVLRGRALHAGVSVVSGVGENFSWVTTSSYGGRITPAQARIFDEAIADYTRALTLDPDNDGIYVERGIAYNNRGDHDRAIADYNRALRLNPRNVGAYNNRGVAYDNKGEPDTAVSNYTEALRLNPNFTEAYNNRGLVYFDKGDNDRAISNYTEALRLNPNDADVYNNRGDAYYSKGDFDMAIADYEAALRINPDHANARFKLTESRKKSGY